MERMLDPAPSRRLELFQGNARRGGGGCDGACALAPEARSLTSRESMPVDLRGLAPPQPLERILSAIAEGSDTPRSFLLSMEPLLLYPLLRREHVRWRVRRFSGGVEITIEPGAARKA
jgi:hypothetical protein